MSKSYSASELANRVFLISIGAIVAWIVAAFAFVILKHP